MISNNDNSDQPDAWRRPVSQQEIRESLPPEANLQDPVWVGHVFCFALEAHEANLGILMRLATPESLENWGDFSAAGSYFCSIRNRGYGSMVDRAFGDDDVAYFKIFSGITESFQVLGDQIMIGAAVLTLVWRAEFGEWRVHSIGDALVPESVPH